MIDLSLCMIVKNEEKNLERCLNSVKGLVNEIIIIDTGSTDATIEKAKALNANVFEHKFEPFDFSAARNLALKHCLGKFILHLDADEELDKDSIPIIEKVISGEPNQALICTIDNYVDKENTFSFQSIRLFPNTKGIHYTGLVHEQIFPSLQGNCQIINSKIKIVHHGYNCSDFILRSKANRNLLLLLTAFEKNPTALTAEQIANTYELLNQPGKVEHYRKQQKKLSRKNNAVKKTPKKSDL